MMHEEFVHIGDGAFKGCTYMITTNLRESSTTEIGLETFEDSGLRTVDLRKITTVDPMRSTGPSLSGRS